MTAASAISSSEFSQVLDVLLPDGGYVMAFYHSYIDESGTDEQSPVMVVGGYLLSAANARDMDSQWRAVLDENNLPYFHMKECAPVPKGPAFAHLSDQECSQVVRRLISLIKRHVIYGTVAVAPQDSPLPSEAAGYGGVYGACLSAAHGFAYRWVTTHAPTARLLSYFERGHASESEARRFLDVQIQHAQHKQVFGPVSFDEKASVPLLQAADLLVWQVRKHLADRFTGARKPRADFRALFNQRHHIFYLNLGLDAQGRGTIDWEIDSEPLKPNRTRDALIKHIFELPDSWGPDLPKVQMILRP